MTVSRTIVHKIHSPFCRIAPPRGDPLSTGIRTILMHQNGIAPVVMADPRIYNPEGCIVVTSLNRFRRQSSLSLLA